MRDIQRLERLVLDAIEQTTDPTLGEVLDYIRARRRVYPWTMAGIMVAVFRLEGEGTIETRRSRGANEKPRWIYRRREEGHAGERCRPCSARGRRAEDQGMGPGSSRS